jgi:hypothetical protein
MNTEWLREWSTGVAVAALLDEKDADRARIAELEGAGRMLAVALADVMFDDIADARARIAELEADNERLRAGADGQRLTGRGVAPLVR